MTIKGLDEITDLLRQLVGKKHQPHRISGGDIVFILKDDHPAEGFTISPVVEKDAEGHVITDTTTTEVTSTDDSVVAVAQPDAEGSPTRYEATFGAPGVATINAVTKNAAGDILVSKAASFTVTTGDPADIEGGDIAFDTLVEVPEPEAPPEPQNGPPATTPDGTPINPAIHNPDGSLKTI